MSAPAQPTDPKAAMRLRVAQWEMVACAQAKELAQMTEARRLEIIDALSEIQAPRFNSFPGALPYSGLVEQQAIFQRARRHD